MSDFVHGTNGAYTHRKCRCAPCREAHAQYRKRWRSERGARLKQDPSLAPHGSVETYNQWECRCDECRSAHTTKARVQRARRSAG
jgi:hypothetical protein